ncbi:MAG: DUF3568 family protein [Candidatus Omnitrophota bacterium]
MKSLFNKFLMLIFLAMSCCGCGAILVGTAAGVAGAYVWTQGNLELNVNYSVEELYQASRAALEELDFMVERDSHDHFEARISARSREQRKTLIRIEGKTELLSRIRVRVGVWGDRDESQIVMNAILRNV